jgi:hypothetical protein
VTSNPSDSPGPVRALRRIGLWGAPSSGKSTFLAALNVATMRSEQDLMMFGVDEDSTEFLVNNTHMLTRERKFPPASQSLVSLSWAIHMQTEVVVPARFGKTSRRQVPLQLNIDVLDAPGVTFGDTRGTASAAGASRLGLHSDEMSTSVAPEEQVIDHLSGADGLLLLFDPMREQATGDAFNYFQGTLLRIAQRRLSSARAAGQRLPQYVAVCVTKFDDPAVYRLARRTGYVSIGGDDHMFPRVQDGDAEEFFGDLCRQPGPGNADLVSLGLRRFFRPDRIRYFISSSIGFYLDSKIGRFRDQDFWNVVPGSDGKSEIRGPIHPINLVEPLLWLGQSLAGGT